MRISSKEQLYFYSSLSSLLDAGVDISEAIENLKESSSKNLIIILSSISTDLNDGKTLSTAMSKFPDVFDDIPVSLIKTGEVSGNLSKILEDIEKNKQTEQEFGSKIKSALYYPLLVVLLFFIIFGIILFYVVPRISEVFSSLDIKIPLSTKILFSLSNFVTTYYLAITFIAIAIFTIFFVFYYYNKQKIINFFLLLPVISKLGKNLDYMRFSRSFYIMLKSGIPIVESLNLSSKVVKRNDIKDSIVDISNSVSSGNSLYQSFQPHKKVFPGFMLQVISASEKSGNLEKSFLKISKYFEKSFDNQLKVTAALFEPLILAVIGVIVATIMISIIAPIYQVMGSIRPY